MQDLLKDIVGHTHNLGFLNVVKITGEDTKTSIDSMADDRTVIMYAETANPYPDMVGVFGMPQLNKLRYHLDCPEYKEGAKIEVVKAERNGETMPIGLHFENATKDFKNDYRFMSTEIINEKEFALLGKSEQILKSGVNNFFIDTENKVSEVVKLYRNILDGKKSATNLLKKDYVLAWAYRGTE